jgi:hypothetical protein
MDRWIFAILLYSFKLVHVPGKKHGPDGLSRRPIAPEDEKESDPEEWVDLALNSFYTGIVYKAEVTSEGKLEDDLEKIKEFLLSTKVPDAFDESQKQRFLRRALQYFVQKGFLWRKSSDSNHRRVPPLEERERIMDECHRQVGHKGIYGTTKVLTDRFWWPTVYKDVASFVKTCHEYQTRSTQKPKRSLTVQQPSGLFRKVCLDAMLMPKSGGYRYVLAARCDLSGWLEARKSSSCSSKACSQFIWEDIYCRWGAIEILVSDNGPDIAKAASILAARYSGNHIKISPYNSRANGVVEKGHFSLRESVLKLCGPDSG